MQSADQYYEALYRHQSDMFSMPELAWYSMSMITEDNLLWQWMVRRLHCISIPICYNCTYLHVCVQSEYGYN